MRKLLISFSMLVLLASVSLAQDNKPAWNVTLETNKTAPSNLTVQNRCKKKHTFDIKLENISFLELGKNEVEVKGGKNVTVPVRFNTTNLLPNKYEGQVLVICKTCNKEPTCTQDREVLPVILTVPGNVNATVANNENANANGNGNANGDQVANNNNQKDPCKEKCEDLLKVANDKDSAAKTAQDVADTAKGAADKADDTAKSAETAATQAEELAKDVPRNDRAIINGEKFTTADTEYRIKLQGEINAAHKAGQISDKEHERQTKANTVRKARDERLKNLAKLKKEAEKARAAADSARRAANEAKVDAEKAQSVADDAKKAADDARNAYNDCIKKAKEECDKLKAAEARRVADVKAAEDARIAEEQRTAAAEKDRLKQKKEDERLLKLIKKLGLVDTKIRDVPSIWQWLPDILETPIGMLAEATTATPVPTDVLKALGGLYGLFAAIQNPCNEAVGRLRIVPRLMKTINEKTGRLYTEPEADAEVTNMCNLMKRLKKNVKALKGQRGIK